MPKGIPGQPWTQEMVIVHRAMRTAFHQAPGLVRSCGADRVALVGRHLRGLLNGLHHHHTAEDELLWPKLSERVPLADLRHIQAAKDQHAGLEPLISRTTVRLDRWRRSPGQEEADGLAEAWSRLAAALDEHLDDEEAVLLPLAAEYITIPEWRALARRAAKGLPKARLLVALGDLLAACQGEEEDTFLRRIPFVARIAWHLAGHRAHARYHVRLWDGSGAARDRSAFESGGFVKR